nr:RNA-directed DNA polymerase, eukaryota [Tanacetum cinerariifolium]
MGFRPMNSLQSNFDQTSKISKTVFISNFPDGCTSKDIWKVFNDYGTVIDVFIPNKKSKAGKRFAFVRFIKVHNFDQLIENLRTIWIGSHHLFANPARFERPIVHSYQKEKSAAPVKAPTFKQPSVTHDFTKCVMGEVHQFSSINKLPVILFNEGFHIAHIAFLGGLWVMIELKSSKAKAKFMEHVGIASWFRHLCIAQADFVAKERIVWVDIEGVPLNAWSRSTFQKIEAKWGEMVELEEGCDKLFARKRICIKTSQKENILESFKIIVKGKVFWARAKELFVWSPSFVDVPEKDLYSDVESVKTIEEANNMNNVEDENNSEVVSDTYFGDIGDDQVQEQHNDKTSNDKEASSYPFNIYGLLGKQSKDRRKTGTSSSIPYPPGFTPNVDNTACFKQDIPVLESVRSPCRNPKSSSRVLKEAVNSVDSYSSNSVDKGIKIKEGGSILEILEEMITVGLRSKAKRDWIKELIYKHKDHHMILDNFVALFGKWIPNNQKLLIILVYAPQSLSAKRLLWNYLESLIISWKGESLLMGDFNEVRCNEESCCLDRHLSDHRPILLKEVCSDFGPSPFRVFHSWLDLPGFDGLVSKSWNSFSLNDSNAVKWFFYHEGFPIGCNSSLMTLIPKVLDPKTVSDFRLISLIGSLYKVVTKILATRLSLVISDLISDVQSAFIPNRKILDGPFIINEVLSRWRSWVRGSLSSGKASIIVNGSLTSEFHFFRGLKQRDPLAPFLFLLIMEALHLSFSRAVDADGMVAEAANSIGCSIMKTPFKYLGILVGDNMSSIKAWDEIVDKMRKRLSRWKLNALSVGGRLTLLKSVLGSSPLYNMSIFKVPKQVLNIMESLRRNFFNGVQEGDRKIAWVKWSKLLASKKFKGLGVSIFFALNRALLFKWVWRYLSRDNSLWYRVISAIHGLNVESSLSSSFRRPVRGGEETQQFDELSGILASVSLSSLDDRWFWDLSGDGTFQVKGIRSLLDETFLPKTDTPTRWIKSIPIKAKIQWAIEGNENSKYFHAIINKKQANLSVKGIMVDGDWIVDPDLVKHEFRNHFADRFQDPGPRRVLDPKTVSDFRPISLIGSLYKVVTKILATRLSLVISDLISDVQSAFIHNRQILDGIFSGYKIDSSTTLSHLLYADDAVFIGEWSHSNLRGIMNILRCFSLLSGMSINIHKSHLLGVGILDGMVAEAANSISCSIMKTPFKYLGILVGDNMSSIKAWDEIVDKMRKRLSRWKLNALSVGEENKDILIADKLNSSLSSSFRHPVRESEETQQFDELSGILASVSLSSLDDRWFWDLSCDGTFQVKGIRSLLDETFLPKMDSPTRWIKSIPIKVNVFVWKLYLDRLPTRSNLIRRNILVSDVVCPLCDLEIEDSSHLFFGCSLAKDIQKLICRWWNLEVHHYESYNGWLSWFKSIRLGSKLKDILEGVFYVSWWSIWYFRNHLLFMDLPPRKDVIFDNIILRSFNWCVARSCRTLNWESTDDGDDERRYRIVDDVEKDDDAR